MDLIATVFPKADELGFNRKNSRKVGDVGSNFMAGAASRSVRYRAADLIQQFPVIMSQDVSQDTALAIRRELEIRSANDMAAVIANQPVYTYDSSVDSDQPKPTADIHQNINLSSDSRTEGLKPEFELNDNVLTEANNVLSIPVEEMFNTSSLNEATIPAGYATFKRSEKEVAGDMIRAKEITQAHQPSEKDVKDAADLIEKYTHSNNETVNNAITKLTHWKEYQASDPNETGVKSIKNEDLEPSQEIPLFTLMEDVEDDVLKSMDKGKFKDSSHIRLEKKLGKVKIDQENSSRPIVLKANRILLDTKTKNTFNMPIEVGVKTVMHPISSQEVIKVLSSSSRNTDMLSMIARFTSGEFKMLGDILFDYSRSRKLATNKSNGGRSMGRLRNFGTLSSTGRFADIAARTGKVKGIKHLIPNASLVVTRGELEAVRLKTGVDLLYKTSAVRKIINDYFLVDFIVVDEDQNKVYMYDLNSGTFDIYSTDDMITITKDYKKLNSKPVDKDDVNKKVDQLARIITKSREDNK